MSNERTPDAPLTATVREELERKQHEGEPSGLDLAERAVADLDARAHEARPGEGEAPGARVGRGGRRPAERRAGGRPGLGWAIAAGVGALVLVGTIRRAFGR